MSTKHPELERGSKIRLFKTNETEATDSPTPRNNEAKMPHGKMYTPMVELTTVRARERVCTYGIPVAIGLQKKEGIVSGFQTTWLRIWVMKKEGAGQIKCAETLAGIKKIIKKKQYKKRSSIKKDISYHSYGNGATFFFLWGLCQLRSSIYPTQESIFEKKENETRRKKKHVLGTNRKQKAKKTKQNKTTKTKDTLR